MSQIIKNNPLPLYFQLKEIIKKDIKSGFLKPGDLILSERELIEYYNISRTPVRQAINELVNEGLLRREHGKGTFVAHQKIEQRFLEQLNSFHDEMMRKGLSFKTKVIQKQIVENDSCLREVFGTSVQKFFRIDRLRFINRDPSVIVTTYIPYSIAPNLFKENFEIESLYNILQTKYEVNLCFAERVIESINVTIEDAEILGLEDLTAILLTRTTGYLEDNTPVEYSIGSYRGDLNRFTIKVAVNNS